MFRMPRPLSRSARWPQDPARGGIGLPPPGDVAQRIETRPGPRWRRASRADPIAHDSSVDLEGHEMGEQRDLEGISALVTGATSGIGRAAAEELARHGAEVIVHGRDTVRGSAVVDHITAEGGKARLVAADLSDPAQLDDLAGQAGEVDVLVNNAGISWFGPTGELDVATFDQLFAANVRAPFFLVAALAPRMATRGSGCIINVASMAGQIGLAGGAAYGATQATLAAMTRAWAAEFSPSGVRVNAIAAGPVLTPGAAPERIEALGAMTLLSRAAQPSEIAEILAFLASPKASYVTGAVIAADGGRTAI